MRLALTWLLQAGVVVTVVWVTRWVLQRMEEVRFRLGFCDGVAAGCARVGLAAVPYVALGFAIAFAAGRLGLGTLAVSLSTASTLTLLAAICLLGLSLPQLEGRLGATRLP